MPVIGMFEDDNIFALGVCARQTQRQFVGLASGVEEVTNFERRWEKSGKARGILQHAVMEVAGIGVEECELPGSSFHHAGVRVSDQGHVVVNIEERAARFIVKILSPATDNFQRVLVRHTEVSAE